MFATSSIHPMFPRQLNVQSSDVILPNNRKVGIYPSHWIHMFIASKFWYEVGLWMLKKD